MATVKSPARGQTRHSTEQTIKNLRAMRVPTNLLKVNSSGKIKFHQFSLTPDMKFLTWVSKSKGNHQTRVRLADVTEVIYGQRTEKFQKAARDDLTSLSFSLVYRPSTDTGPGLTSGPSQNALVSSTSSGNLLGGSGSNLETLDIVCKDEREFQQWGVTLLELHKGQIDQKIIDQVLNEPVGMSSSGVAERRVNARHRSEDGKTTHDVYSFGWGEWGQTGLGNDMPQYNQPKVIKEALGKGAVQIAGGWAHTAILLESGNIMMCGNRLGTGLDDDSLAPRPLPSLKKVSITLVACGAFHTVALNEKGEMFTWGCNFHGQLGLGTNKDVSEPTLVEKLRDTMIVQVAAGEQATIALSDDKGVYTWGKGARGNLGHNDEKDRLAPECVQELDGTPILLIAAGGSHMFACADRETYAWGCNASGQLGLGHDEDQHRPQTVDTLRGQKVLDISAGAAHSACVVANQRLDQNVLYTWGSNSCGQLGNNSKTNVLKPTPVIASNFSGSAVVPIIVQVSCGDLSTYARSENNVYACGSNLLGQLGLGHNNEVHQFELVSFFKDKQVRSVVAGGMHCAVLTAQAWVDDSEAKECMQCKAAFTFTLRKHHCRNCGGIFCNACSSKKTAILKQGIEPVRVCDNCYVKLTRVNM